jgi:hypothetical protein
VLWRGVLGLVNVATCSPGKCSQSRTQNPGAFAGIGKRFATLMHSKQIVVASWCVCSSIADVYLLAPVHVSVALAADADSDTAILSTTDICIVKHVHKQRIHATDIGSLMLGLVGQTGLQLRHVPVAQCLSRSGEVPILLNSGQQ